MNLPMIDLNTIVFEKDKPYFYVINENYVEKYAYELTVPVPKKSRT